MLKMHCDSCDRVLSAGASAALSTGAFGRVKDGQTCYVTISIQRAEHLCHPCRKSIFWDAVHNAVMAEWWDPK
mgnify:CR=1 FL=1